MRNYYSWGGGRDENCIFVKIYRKNLSHSQLHQAPSATAQISSFGDKSLTFSRELTGSDINSNTLQLALTGSENTDDVNSVFLYTSTVFLTGKENPYCWSSKRSSWYWLTEKLRLKSIEHALRTGMSGLDSIDDSLLFC